MTEQHKPTYKVTNYGRLDALANEILALIGEENLTNMETLGLLEMVKYQFLLDEDEEDD